MLENVKPKKTGRLVSLMVWGAFAEGIKGLFLIFKGIDRSVTSQYYLKQMQENLLRFIEHIADILDIDVIFM